MPSTTLCLETQAYYVHIWIWYHKVQFTSIIYLIDHLSVFFVFLPGYKSCNTNGLQINTFWIMYDSLNEKNGSILITKGKYEKQKTFLLLEELWVVFFF